MICDVCNAEVGPNEGARVTPKHFRELLDLGFGFDTDNLKMLTDSGMPVMQARTLLRQQYLQSTSDWLLCDDCVSDADELRRNAEAPATTLNSSSSRRSEPFERQSSHAFAGWWRWPLIPIAALLAAVVGSVLFGIVQWIGMKTMGGFHEDGWYYLYIMPLMSSGVFGYIWCLVAGYVAPRGKFIITVVMATVLAMLGVFLIAVHFANPERYSTHPVVMVFSVIATLIGSVIAGAQIAEEEADG